jgi:glycine cleavage system aminomethyltransferase T
VTSAASGPSVGRHLLMAYLPVAEALVGAQLSVEYFGDLYPVTVAVVGGDPLYSREPDRSATGAREQVTPAPTSAAPPGASLD